MAYKNLLNIDCADKKEFFCRMRDFICKRNGTYDYSSTGIGWTLHDSSYAVDEDNPAANDWYVICSPGEGGKDDMYFKIAWNGSQTNNITISGFLYHAVPQTTLTTNLTYSGNTTTIEVTTPIPHYTPQVGKIGIELDSGLYNERTYTSWAGSTFTFANTNIIATAGNDVFVRTQGIGEYYSWGHRLRVDDTGDAYILHIYGDLDAISVLHEDPVGTVVNTSISCFGRTEPAIVADAIALCSGSPASGSDISITVDAVPSGWAVGRRIFIRDNAGIERIEIKTLVGTTITADLAKSYVTPKLSEHVGYHNGYVNNSSLSSPYFILLNNGSAGTVSGLQYSGLETATDPELLNDTWVLYPFYLGGSDCFMGYRKNVLTFSSVGLTDRDVFEDEDGNEWRYINVTSDRRCAFLEV